MNEEIVKLVEAAKKGDKKAVKVIQNIMKKAEQGDLEAVQIAQQIQQLVLKKAAHGTKLTYFKKLKNKCPEGEELVYYKIGGKMGCGCLKIKSGSTGMEAPEMNLQRKKTVAPASNNRTIVVSSKEEKTANNKQKSLQKPLKKVENEKKALDTEKCRGKLKKKKMFFGGSLFPLY